MGILTSLDRRVARPPQLRATGGRAGEGELPKASRPLFPPTFSARRFLSEIFTRKAQRERQRQPRVVVTLGDWVVGELCDEEAGEVPMSG